MLQCNFRTFGFGVQYRTVFLIVYNFVYKRSVYFLLVDNYRLQYLLENYIT